MTRRSRDELALRREALTTRAALQRLELASTLDQAREAALSRKGLGVVAVQLVRAFAASRGGPTGALSARPWMFSAGWLVLRALRASPTARWVTAAAAVGGAAWWVVRALREADSTDDGSG